MIQTTAVFAFENDTLDKLFLLSVQDYGEYFSDKESAICQPTEYAVAHGVETNLTRTGCWWWLRSSGPASLDVANVDPNGALYVSGRYVAFSSVAV